jgi:hypothetical protein
MLSYREDRLNRDAAITNFIEHVDHLASLPFITDQEVERLYGEEVAAALGELERINLAEKICRRCESNCCQTHGCEFYAGQFRQCPIHDLRPAICRFHFCEKFHAAAAPNVEELSEIFLYSLSTASASGSQAVKFFNPPPFAGAVPGLVETVTPAVEKVRSGKLKPGCGQRRVREEVMKYNAVPHLSVGDTNTR